MPIEGYSMKQILVKLREAEIELGRGLKISRSCSRAASPSGGGAATECHAIRTIGKANGGSAWESL